MRKGGRAKLIFLVLIERHWARTRLRHIAANWKLCTISLQKRRTSEALSTPAMRSNVLLVLCTQAALKSWVWLSNACWKLERQTQKPVNPLSRRMALRRQLDY